MRDGSTTVAQPNQAELGQAHCAGARVVLAVLRQAQRVALAALLEAGRAKARGALRIPGLAQVLQRLLQRLCRGLAQPRVLRLERRQPRAQRGMAGPLAAGRHLRSLVSQSLVEDDAPAANPTTQHGLALRLQAQCEPEALTDEHARRWMDYQ